MLGSSFSISDPNTILNSIVADVLSGFADRLEKASDFEKELKSLMKETIKKHKRIIFNGNNYSDEWVEEAQKRGLLNLKTTVDALPYFVEKKNIELFTRLGIFSEKEIRSRYEIMLENYCKVVNIEALTMLEMARKDILPAVISYSKKLADTAVAKKTIGIDITDSAELTLAKKIDALTTEFYRRIESLDKAIAGTHECTDLLCEAQYFRDKVLSAMQELRAVSDELETIVAKDAWPFPTYGDLLFSV